MTIASITYQNIIDEVKTWVKTSCINITNYASIPQVYKSYNSGAIGVGNTEGIGGGYTSTITITLKSQAVAQATTTNVDTAMTSWLSYIGLTNPSAVITDNQFPIFFNNMVGFCTRYMAITSSQYSEGTKYLIFVDTGSSNKSSSSITDKMVKPYTVTETLRVLKDVVNDSLKAHPVIYDFGQ